MKKEPLLNEGFSVEIVLDNKAMEDELNTEKPELLSFLRNELKNFEISITHTIQKADTSNKLYTNKDKYLFMVKKNPNLEKLKQKLDLDIEY